MNDIVKDISTLSTINEKHIRKIIELERLSIIDSVVDDLTSENDVSGVDIGIGALYVKNDNDKLKIKFIPSDDLVDGIINSLKGNKSSLETTIEKTLIERVSNVYKELIP